MGELTEEEMARQMTKDEIAIQELRRENRALREEVEMWKQRAITARDMKMNAQHFEYEAEERYKRLTEERNALRALVNELVGSLYRVSTTLRGMGNLHGINQNVCDVARTEANRAFEQLRVVENKYLALREPAGKPGTKGEGR